MTPRPDPFRLWVNVAWSVFAVAAGVAFVAAVVWGGR